MVQEVPAVYQGAEAVFSIAVQIVYANRQGRYGCSLN